MQVTFADVSVITAVILFGIVFLWTIFLCDAKNRLPFLQSVFIELLFEYAAPLYPIVLLVIFNPKGFPLSVLSVTAFLIILSYVNACKNPWTLLLTFVLGVGVTMAFLSGATAGNAVLSFTSVNFGQFCNAAWGSPLGITSLLGIWVIGVGRTVSAIKSYAPAARKHWIVEWIKAYEGRSRD